MCTPFFYIYYIMFALILKCTHVYGIIQLCTNDKGCVLDYMKNKKVLIGVSSIFIITILAITLSLTLFKSEENIVLSDNENNKNLINNSFLTLMLEQEDGTYLESTTNTWPSGNYAFNSELSRCENGGELEWDREQGIVKLLSNKSDGCYVYFDLYNVVTITNLQATKTTNSVTLTVTVDAGENPVATYYFSIDGGRSYQESNTNTYTFSNLDYGTTYTIQIYAVDTLGYESNEEVIEVTTDNYVNPVVNSVTTTNIENDSITVSVSATGGTNNIQTYYYSINNGAYTSSSSNSYTFSGLSSGQSYSIRVYVRDTNGIDSNVYTINAETENVVYLADVCSNGNNLASCITSFYNSYGTDRTNIYYHTAELENSTEDNSYRYAGANPNNYVCFGSTSSTCSNDNLYRIIGVFDGEVKLIKSTSYGIYSWSGVSWGTTINTWSDNSLSTSILNRTYLSSFGSIWRNLIATHSWKVGGMSFGYGLSMKQYFNYEVGANSSSTTYSAKIGLLYVSDYGYAVGDSTMWGTSLYGFKDLASNNWLYIGDNEWSITRYTSNTTHAFYGSSTSFTGGDVSEEQIVRPAFYLSSSVQYSSGSGTSSDPIRLSVN